MYSQLFFSSPVPRNKSKHTTSILNKNNISTTKMLSKQLLLILAVVFTITANNADASIAADERRALQGQKCKDKKKNKKFSTEKNGEKQTCSEWIEVEDGCEIKKVKQNCQLSCGYCTAAPTESPTAATCEDKDGKFKVKGRTTCAKLVELCPGSCGLCSPTASPTAMPTASPTPSPTEAPTDSPTEKGPTDSPTEKGTTTGTGTST